MDDAKQVVNKRGKNILSDFRKEKDFRRTKTLQLILGQQQLNNRDCVRYLGMYIDKHLSFKEHIKILTNKINKFSPTAEESEMQSPSQSVQISGATCHTVWCAFI